MFLKMLFSRFSGTCLPKMALRKNSQVAKRKSRKRSKSLVQGHCSHLELWSPLQCFFLKIVSSYQVSDPALGRGPGVRRSLPQVSVDTAHILYRSVAAFGLKFKF